MFDGAPDGSAFRYGSVCSGIEAASVAWHPLGWRASFLSEIEAFPRAVLAHHYPATPLHGDFTSIEAGEYEPIDLLVGGTPCQSFSVAGLRGGLADDRGNLALEFLRLAQRLRPRWLVWENVPGILSSNGGRDFGAILGGMAELGYGFAYRVLDAQFFGVPQRRRRVFAVGYLGDWRRAAAVLFERHSLSGNPPPRREAGERVADSLTVGANQYSGFCGEPVANCLTSREAKGPDSDATTTLVATTLRANSGHNQVESTYLPVAHSIRAEGFDASEDGTGRGTPLVPVAFGTFTSNGDAHSGFQNEHGLVPIALDLRNALRDPDKRDEVNRQGCGIGDDVAHTLSAGAEHGVAHGMTARRLTPRECERLQGFPDDYTLIPYRGKPAADGPRYKALGNSMAVPVMRWIGERIQMADTLASTAARARAGG